MCTKNFKTRFKWQRDTVTVVIKDDGFWILQQVKQGYFSKKSESLKINVDK